MIRVIEATFPRYRLQTSCLIYTITPNEANRANRLDSSWEKMPTARRAIFDGIILIIAPAAHSR